MEIIMVGPQFTRTDGRLVPEAIAMPEFFDWLKRQPAATLKTFGMQEWDNGLWLLPHEWYKDIPNGTELIDIFGEKEVFERGVTDDDMRYGCLAYGIQVQPPLSEG